MELKVKFNDYYYDHGCGCCSSWGTEATFEIDGKVYEYNVSSQNVAWERFMEDHYNVALDIEETSEYDSDATSHGDDE